MNIAQCVERVENELARAGLCFGHGTDNVRDEAAWLVLHSIGAPLDGSFDGWDHTVTPEQQQRVEKVLTARIEQRLPLAYLLGTAWFAGLEFEVSPATLVPRSPLAELILDDFQPWLDPARIRRVLDLCTGSACIAIATAVQLPNASVVASDISTEALAVAQRNVSRHGVGDRLRLVESNLFQSLPPERYDLILSNPPYVPAGRIASLPEEYRREPELGLVSGKDGLDACLEILIRAPAWLNDGGALICEVGESEEALARLLPSVPFTWLEFERGGTGVFLLYRDQLLQAQDRIGTHLESRKHVT